jgi:HTH-type transcriptional regulator/antitoxin HigA
MIVAPKKGGFYYYSKTFLGEFCLYKQLTMQTTNNWISPPGDTILDIAKERGWTIEQLSQQLNYTIEYTNQLIGGEALIDKDVAIRLEQVLGSTSSFWLNRELQYRMLLSN